MTEDERTKPTDTPSETESKGLLETVRDPKPIANDKELDDKGEPEGGNFA